MGRSFQTWFASLLSLSPFAMYKCVSVCLFAGEPEIRVSSAGQPVSLSWSDSRGDWRVELVDDATRARRQMR